MNYYNEIDPHAAEWLRELIAQGSLPAGYVDERSIVDVRAEDLEGYRQSHFFAGIGALARVVVVALVLQVWVRLVRAPLVVLVLTTPHMVVVVVVVPAALAALLTVIQTRMPWVVRVV